MPELPDVEVYKRYFDDNCLHKRIDNIEILDSTLVKSSPDDLQALKDQTFQESRRQGKYLFLKTKDEHWVIMHFGMTGYLEYFKVNGEPPEYAKVLFYFSKNRCLSFINKRKFGYIDLTDNLDEWIKDKGLGPDALEISKSEFLEVYGSKKGQIKSALMDQKTMVGVGNIYADEILFQTKIHPKKATDSLENRDLQSIYEKMQYILKAAIKHNAHPTDLPEDYFVHSREEGADCPSCDGSVSNIKVGGRSTYYCPSCQKK